MCTLYERIQELCRRKGVSGSRMCLDLGLSKSTLSDIKNGRKKGISTSTAQKFAAYLDVSVGYLLGEEDEKKDQASETEGTNMCTLDERIQELCRRKGVSGSRMCLDLGMSKSFMTELRKGRAKSIKIETAQKIAAYFGITVDELYGNEAKKEQTTEIGDLSEKRKALMQFAMSVPEDKADMILQVMKTILDND